MKINEIILEGGFNPDGSYETSDDEALEFDELEGDLTGDGEGFGEPEMQLSSNADAKMIKAVKRVCDEYKGQGHAQVEILPFISKVIELAKKPVNLADLIAINKQSPEIRSIIDSIDDKKIKFKNMSVKNEDPNKQAKEKDATVGGMAGRAAGRDRGI
jgi:hypothetical protein